MALKIYTSVVNRVKTKSNVFEANSYVCKVTEEKTGERGGGEGGTFCLPSILNRVNGT